MLPAALPPPNPWVQCLLSHSDASNDGASQCGGGTGKGVSTLCCLGFAWVGVGGVRALRAPQPCHYGLSDRTHVTFSVVDKLRPLPHATPTSPCWRPPPGRPKRIYFYSEQFCFFPRRKENSLGNDFKSQVLGSSCPCPSPILFRTNFMDFFSRV